jgi:2-C-methyl-D-erythritol 2,4-cyclodiphosphate synthase
MNIRVGFGYDVHRLEDGEEIILGGISIPSSKKAMGHSDADVLIHAICDALLGAAGLRDIGVQFPNTESAYKGIDSKILLGKTMEMVRAKGYYMGNIDATVCLENPKINPYIENMIKALSQTMHVGEDQISIKATTNEGLGYVGREDGVTAYAVALILKN